MNDPRSRKVRLKALKLTASRPPVDVRTFEVTVEYEGMEISVILPVQHLYPGIYGYHEQAQEFFRQVADQIEEHQKAQRRREASE